MGRLKRSGASLPKRRKKPLIKKGKGTRRSFMISMRGLKISTMRKGRNGRPSCSKREIEWI